MASSTCWSLPRKRDHLLDEQPDLQSQGAGPTAHGNAASSGVLERRYPISPHMTQAGSLEEGRQGSRIGGSDESRGGIGLQKRQDTAARQAAQHLEQFRKG